MGIFNSVFGSESETKSRVTPYDQAHVDSLLARIKAMGGNPMEMFPEQMYADMTPEQTQALDMRRQFAGGMGQMTDPAMAAWQQSLSAPDVANNPYVQGMMDQNATSLNRNFQEMMPGIDAAMLGVNERLGGSGQGVAQGITARGTQEALANANAGMMMDAYGQGLDQQKFAMGAAPGMAQFGMMPADIMMGVGDVERAEAQKGITEDISRFNFAQQEPINRLQNEMSMSQGLTLPFASTESKSESTPSPFSSAMQLGSLGMGAMSMPGMPWGGGSGMGGVPGGYSQALMPQNNYGMMQANPGFMPGSGMGFQGGAFPY